MRLYPKNLRDIKSLEREKARLLRKKGDLEESNIILSGALSSMGKKGGKKSGGDTSGAGNELFTLAEPLIQIAKEIVIGRLTKKNTPAEAENKKAGPKVKNNSIVKRVAFEFIGGYLKWKVVELGFKTIRRLIKAKAKKVSPAQ